LHNSFIDWEMGLNKKDDFVDESPYWEKIRMKIRVLVGKSQLKVRQLILTGESALDSRFLKTARDALADLVEGEVLTVL
jgi:hypothetical protein